MHKKMIGAVVALALVAFAAVPALASATPVLKDSAGTVAVGTAIAGTNIGNTKMTTSLGTIECQTSVVTGTVAKNNGTEIEGNVETASFTGTGTGGKCTTAFLGNVEVVANKLPWCLKAGGKLAKDAFNITSNKCSGGGTMEFTLNTEVAGTCTYTAPSVSGTYTTGTNAATRAVLTVSEQEFTKSAGGFFCPGSGKLDMQFNLETNNSEKLPIWIE